jgi:uncharacterized protein (DUF433 family)
VFWAKPRYTEPMETVKRDAIGAVHQVPASGEILPVEEGGSVSTEIIRDPEICGGAPIVEGTRIGVHHVAGYSQIYGENPERIREEALPDLTSEQINAALDWYREHREEIDEIRRQHREGYERLLSEATAVR